MCSSSCLFIRSEETVYPHESERETETGGVVEKARALIISREETASSTLIPYENIHEHEQLYSWKKPTDKTNKNRVLFHLESAGILIYKQQLVSEYQEIILSF